MNSLDIAHIISSGEWVGWVATVLFALSYLVARPLNLLLLQALAASLWIAYGTAIGAMPVVIANGVVFTGALYKAWSTWRASAR